VVVQARDAGGGCSDLEMRFTDPAVLIWRNTTDELA